MALRLPPVLASIPWWGWAGALAALGIGVLGGKAAALKPGASPEAAPPTGGPPPGAPPLLKLGAKGEWVRYLQKLLGIAETGTFDAQVRAAVVAYQKSKGLDADGLVGKQTWGALGVSGSATPKPKPGGGALQNPPPGDFLGSAGTDPWGLPENIGEREAIMLQAVQAGQVDHQWTPIQWNAGGHLVKALVSRRAFALNDGATRLVINATMPTAQKIGNLIGGSMLTTRMSDEIWKLADVKLAPTTQPWSQDGTMSKTSRMLDQSARIDNDVAKAGGGANSLVANEGKDWVITRRFWLPPEGIGSADKMHRAANFGWYGAGSSKSPGGETVIQSIGLAHDLGHTDYSQLIRFVKTDSVSIDGEPVDLASALADPALSAALQDEGGTMPGVEHPDFAGVA